METMFHCRMCKNPYPRTKEYFNKSHGTRDGMRKECRWCQSITNAYYRNRYRKKFDRLKLITNEEYDYNMRFYIGYSEEFVNRNFARKQIQNSFIYWTQRNNAII